MSRSLFLLPVVALALVPAALAQTFTISATAIPAAGNNIWTDGVAIADVDNDGDNDILFANGNVYGGAGAAGALPQHLYLNDGTGMFTAAHAMLAVANFNAKMVIAQDFDADGWLDVMYSSGSTGSPPRYLRNKGEIASVWQGFVDETASRVPALALRSFCVCAGDVDNDGDLDVVVNDGGTFGGSASQARLLRNDGTGVFTDVTAAQMPVDLYNCQDVLLLDFDGDYDIDISLSGKGSGGLQGRLYLNSGAGTFSVNTVRNLVGSGNTYEEDSADLDGDTDFDSAVQSVSGFSEGWARNNGTGSAMTKTTFPAPNGDDDNEMACMDYDNDGDQDVFIASLGTAEKVYKNTAAVFAKQTVPLVIQAKGGSQASLDLALGDLNNDGKYDMVTAQGESGSLINKVYMNSGLADTLAPVFLRTETPGGIGAAGTVFRAQIRDSISDDGVISATMHAFWATAGVGAGVGNAPAFHQGTGTFRASVPTTAGTTGVSLWWVATDDSGNQSFSGPVSLGVPPASAWTDIGFGLAGTAGIPALAGTGTLQSGSPASLSLTGAAPSAPAILFVSFISTPVPFKGGMLAAFPFVLTVSLATSAGGAIPLPFLWPTGLPSGFHLIVQYAIADTGGPLNAALSNTLDGVTP